MTAKKWYERIVNAMQGVGTYREEFIPVVETLASILEKRDLTEKAFKESGGQTVVTAERGNGYGEVSKRNPAIALINDLNAQALSYWRDLGLTPSGLKKISEDALKPKRSALAEALAEVGRGIEGL